MIRWMTVAAALMVIPGTALAGGDQDRIYEFDDLDIDADTEGAAGTWIETDNGGDQDSFVEPRRHFVPEMLESVESF